MNKVAHKCNTKQKQVLVKEPELWMYIGSEPQYGDEYVFYGDTYLTEGSTSYFDAYNQIYFGRFRSGMGKHKRIKNQIK